MCAQCLLKDLHVRTSVMGGASEGTLTRTGLGSYTHHTLKPALPAYTFRAGYKQVFPSTTQVTKSRHLVAPEVGFTQNL